MVLISNNQTTLINNNTKSIIIDYVRKVVHKSNYIFDFLLSVDELKSLKNNYPYTSLYYRGSRYLLTINLLHNDLYINLLDTDEINTTNNYNSKNTITIKVSSIYYEKLKLLDKSVFDGILSNKTFIIHNCFALLNYNFENISIYKKYEIMKKELSSLLSFNVFNTIYFELNELYNSKSILKLINNVSYVTHTIEGLLFYSLDGSKYKLYIDEKCEIVSKNSVYMFDKECITTNYINYLLHQDYDYLTPTNYKKFWLSKTSIPDVYNISNEQYGTKIDIALIPTYKISTYCRSVIHKEPMCFNCIFSKKFNKWIPVVN